MLSHDEAEESDWKLFRARLPGWQEKHIQQLCDEYVAILTGDKRGSDAFWEVEKRIRKDKQTAGVRARMSRSEMPLIILELLHKQIIGWDDLEGFSDSLQSMMKFILLGESEETEKTS